MKRLKRLVVEKKSVCVRSLFSLRKEKILERVYVYLFIFVAKLERVYVFVIENLSTVMVTIFKNEMRCQLLFMLASIGNF